MSNTAKANSPKNYDVRLLDKLLFHLDIYSKFFIL